MASYITPYSGAGSFLPSGYMQAATAGAQSAARSIERGADALGDGLAKGIEKYKKNKADGEAVSTMLETTLPSVLENSQIEMRAGNDDEEAAAILKQSDRFKAQEMKLSEKKAFAAELMLFQKREGEKKASDQKNQQFWYQANAMKENADRTYDATERERENQQMERMWEVARRNGMALKTEARNEKNDAAAAVTAKYVEEDRERAEEERKRVATERSQQAADLKKDKDSKKALAEALLNSGNIDYTSPVTTPVASPNPAYQDYVSAARSEYEANKPVRPEVIDEFRSQPIPETGESVSQTGESSGEEDPEFFRETLARAIDSISVDVNDTYYKKIPEEYGVGGGWAYKDRSPDNIPDSLTDHAIFDRRTVNRNRVGALLQQMKRDGHDTPQIRALDYLTNGPKRRNPPQAPDTAPQAPDTANQDLINSARGVSNYGVNALPPVGPAFDPSSLENLPPETIVEDVESQQPMTDIEKRTANRQYILESMPDASATDKLLALNQLNASTETPSVKTITDKDGNKWESGPKGFVKVKPEEEEKGRGMQNEALRTYTAYIAAGEDLDDLELQFQDHTATGPLVGLLKQLNPYDGGSRKFMAAINSSLPNLARGVFGEVGVLTDKDMERYRGVLPSLRTPQNLGEALISALRQKLQVKKDAWVDTYDRAGFDVEGFKEQTTGVGAGGNPQGGLTGESNLSVTPLNANGNPY